MKHNAMLRSALLFLTSFILFTCNESTTSSSATTGTGIQGLKVSQNSVSVALNSSQGVQVKGGTGSYAVKSMTDSGIVQVSIYPSSSGSPQNSVYVSFSGLKEGTTTVTIQDSAKSGEVDILVVVKIMVASQMSFSLKPGRSDYGYVSGGTSPYTISQPANAAIATVTLSSSSFTVKGIAQGSTSFTISDASTPAHTVTIPITVTLPEKFTTLGKLSMNSGAGNINVEGVFTGDNHDAVPTNDAGAGGFLMRNSFEGNFGQIIAYRRITPTLFDLVVMIFSKSSLTAGTISLDTAQFNNTFEGGIVAFGFNAEIFGRSNTAYVSYSGDITFSVFNDKKAEGSFKGSAAQQSNSTGEMIPGTGITFSGGSFSVPLIVEEFAIEPIEGKDHLFFDQIEKTMKPFIDRAKKQLELKRGVSKRK